MLSSDHLLIQRRCDHPFLRYDSISPYSQFRMKQKTCIHILKIKLFSHTGHKYYRKFKSLTLVDRHDPYRIGLLIFYICFPVIHMVLFQFFNIAHKMKQSLITGSFKSPRLFTEHLDIRFPLRAARHCSYIVSIPGI